MAISILICDDSALARKQLSRVIPASWGANIEFAQHGWEAIHKLEANTFDILFLDLTMPELDGYGTLEEIQKRNIAISGDNHTTVDVVENRAVDVTCAKGKGNAARVV